MRAPRFHSGKAQRVDLYFFCAMVLDMARILENFFFARVLPTPGTLAFLTSAR
jgi:hypothetical protein